jgi:GNAT superfamily N-acetyltransferase
MFKTVRTNSKNEHFVALVKLLDKDLAIRDGDEHDFYAQFNKIQLINHVVVVCDNEIPIACGAFKEFDTNTVEIKRMYTIPIFRSKGVASKILNELELWAAQLGYQKCILETGKKQPEAIHLYQKCGYKITENYGQYAGIENSICFNKNLNQ